MKRNIAIVAGGDTSEIVVSLRSAQGIYSFIDTAVCILSLFYLTIVSDSLVYRAVSRLLSRYI